MRPLAGILALALLAGCMGNPLSGLLATARGLAEDPRDMPVQRQITLAEEMTLSAPVAYCVDSAASRPQDGFALMAGCARLGHGGGLPGADGLLSLQLGRPGSAAQDMGGLAALLAQDAGRRMLSQRGRARDISALEISQGEGHVLAGFDDAGWGGRSWRGFANVEGRLVVVTLRSFDGVDVAPRDARRLLINSYKSLESTG